MLTVLLSCFWHIAGWGRECPIHFSKFWENKVLIYHKTFKNIRCCIWFRKFICIALIITYNWLYSSVFYSWDLLYEGFVLRWKTHYFSFLLRGCFSSFFLRLFVLTLQVVRSSVALLVLYLTVNRLLPFSMIYVALV